METLLSRWEEEILEAAREGRCGALPNVTFDCETLKADADAQRHIRRFLPGLEGQDAVINVGKMVASGVKFEAKKSSKKRGSDEAFAGDVSKGHDEPGGCESLDDECGDWLEKKWKLEEGGKGGGWFTRTTKSETEVLTSKRKGNSNGCLETRNRSAKMEEEREKHKGGSSESAQVSEPAGYEKEDEKDGLSGVGNLLRSAETTASRLEGTLHEKLRSIEEAMGLPSERQLRPTPLTRKVLEGDDTDKEGWL